MTCQLITNWLLVHLPLPLPLPLPFFFVQFPEKSMFYVKPEQAALRRYQLQRWLQKIGANALLVKGEHFQNFLLNAQKEVQKGPEEDVQLEIFLAHGRSVKVDIMSTDQTDDVLETAMSAIGLDPSYVYYFGLYLVEDNTGKVIVRKLQDFESPFVSLARAEKGQIVQMRKAYWDPRVDQELHKDPIALNLYGRCSIIFWHIFFSFFFWGRGAEGGT